MSHFYACLWAPGDDRQLSAVDLYSFTVNEFLNIYGMGKSITLKEGISRVDLIILSLKIAEEAHSF